MNLDELVSLSTPDCEWLPFGAQLEGIVYRGHKGICRFVGLEELALALASEAALLARMREKYPTAGLAARQLERRRAGEC